MTRAHNHSLLLAGRLLLVAAMVAGALYLSPLPAAATLNPTCVQRCTNNSNECVRGCNRNVACTQGCRNIYDACLATCEE